MNQPKVGTLARLAAQAIVVPSEAGWHPQALGAGTVVRIAEPAVSPVSFAQNEICVFWADSLGRQSLGWLAQTTILNATEKSIKSLSHVACDPEARGAPLDRLRELVMKQAETESVKAWSIASWCRSFGGEQLDALRDVIRELGGRVSKDVDEQTIINQALRLIYGKEIPMPEVAAKTPRKSAGKTSAKKSAKKSTSGETSAPARSMARTASVAAVAALEKAGATKHLVALAKRLENGLGKKEIVELRDGINACASEARTNNKPAVATSLSSVNRLVRRISRKD